jgi:predicted dehydrogenase
MNAIHQIDVLRYVTGLEVQRVSAEWVNFTGLAEVEDMISVVLRYQNGAIGSIDTANYAPGGGEPHVVRVYGTRGQLQLAGRGLRLFAERPVEGVDGVPDLPAGDWQEVPLTPGPDGRRLLAEDFVAAVQAGREPPVTGEDGRAALATVLAAYESAAGGRTVALRAT